MTPRRLFAIFGGSHRFAEFLPDAEGVVERRHSPVAGVLIVAVALVFVAILGGAALTSIEQVVRAEGQVEPAGRVKLINHPDGGRVAEIHVREGDRIAAGAPLITFDPEVVYTRLAELTGHWQVRTIEAARLRAEANATAMAVDPEIAERRADLLREQQALLEIRRDSHGSQVDALAQMIERRAREIDTISAELAGLRQSHALLSEQMDAIRDLAAKGYYPRLRLVAVERQLSDLVGDIGEARARREAAAAALAEAKSRHEGFARQRRSEILGELATVTAERDRLAEARKRQLATLRNLVVRAPVDGIVQDLEVTTPGQSVGSNQPLMRLVPTDGGLVIEAKVANEDIGYLRSGQPATIKIHAFDFLRFGTLSGTVARIDADAAVDPKSGGLTYGITVHTDGTELGADSDKLQVTPGMAVEVDLLVGERTILSYLTDRIFRATEASFREG